MVDDVIVTGASVVVTIAVSKTKDEVVCVQMVTLIEGHQAEEDSLLGEAWPLAE